MEAFRESVIGNFFAMKSPNSSHIASIVELFQSLEEAISPSLNVIPT